MLMKKLSDGYGLRNKFKFHSITRCLCSQSTAPSIDYYTVLGLKEGANTKDIKAAYFKAAKRYHPDSAKSLERDEFHRISEAYGVLGDPKKRAEYDIKRKARNESQEFDRRFVSSMRRWNRHSIKPTSANASETLKRNKELDGSPLEFSYIHLRLIYSFAAICIVATIIWSVR